MLNNEQFAAAQKAQLATLMGLAATGLDAAEKLVALNLETARAALAEHPPSEFVLRLNDVLLFLAVISIIALALLKGVRQFHPRIMCRHQQLRLNLCVGHLRL